MFSPVRHTVVAALVLTGAVSAGAKPSDADIDKMTTYSVLIGRAMGCGIAVKTQSDLVTQWVNSKFKGYDELQMVFAMGVAHHAKQQAAGTSPDSCSSVSKTIDSMKEPYWWQGGGRGKQK